MLRLLRSNLTPSFALAQKAIRRLSSSPPSSQMVVRRSSIVHPTPRISPPRAFSSLNQCSKSVSLVISKNFPIPDPTTVKTKVIFNSSESSGFVVKGKFALCSCHGVFVPLCRPRPDMVHFDARADIFVSFWDGTFTTAKVRGVDPAADLAVLTCRTRDDCFVMSPSKPITFFSKSGKSAVFSHPDYVSKDFYAIIIQMATRGGGRSGGPVVDEDQRAMGVLVGGTEKSMLGFVTPIQYGMRLLEYVLEKNLDRTILVNHVELF